MKWIVIPLLLLFLVNIVSAETISKCNGNYKISITNSTYKIGNETIPYSQIDRTYCVLGCNDGECIYGGSYAIIIALLIIIFIIILIKLFI